MIYIAYIFISILLYKFFTKLFPKYVANYLYGRDNCDRWRKINRVMFDNHHNLNNSQNKIALNQLRNIYNIVEQHDGISDGWRLFRKMPNDVKLSVNKLYDDVIICWQEYIPQLVSIKVDKRNSELDKLLNNK